MKKNMGTIDRLLRAVVGIIIITAGFVYQNWWGAVGAIPLITSLISWCPIYKPFKISTNKSA